MVQITDLSHVYASGYIHILDQKQIIPRGQ